MARFAPPHRFACLSDCDVSGVDTIPLKHDWPRWWPIIEVFRPGLFDGRVLYLDLADLIVGDLAPLASQPGFVVAPEPIVPGPGKMCSGVMLFSATDNEIYKRFDRGAITRLRGDQDWIAELRPYARKFRHDWVISYKGHCVLRKRPIGDARIVLFHGIPKPPQAEQWVRDLWDADWRAAE